MDLVALFAALCVLGAIIVALLGIRNATASPRDSLDRRLGRLMGESLGDDWQVNGGVAEGLRQHREGRIPVIGSLIKGRVWVEEAASDLQKADMKLTVSEFVAMRLFFAAIFSAVAYLLLGPPLGIFLGVVFGIVGYLLPRIYMSRAKGKRISKLEAQLPDALTMLANSLKAGFGLMQSLELASRELEHPLAT